MIAKTLSAIPLGYEGKIVEVEGDMNKGLPAFNIVGMANKTVSEARERVKSAIINSNFTFPDKKVTINLAPADLLKDGSHLDLPIALTILAVSRQLTQSDLKNKMFIGELSLSPVVHIQYIAAETGDNFFHLFDLSKTFFVFELCVDNNA